MNYSHMVELARQKGVGESVMLKSVARVDKLLDCMVEHHPDAYAAFMRGSYEDMFGPHYNEEYAREDVDLIDYTDKQGRQQHGAHWTIDEVKSVTRDMAFDAKVTPYDKWVAFNSFYADTCKVLTDDEIIRSAYQYFFCDEDAPDGKIWLYMTAVIGK